jgi:hypothetical protein
MLRDQGLARFVAAAGSWLDAIPVVLALVIGGLGWWFAGNGRKEAAGSV